MIVNYKTTNAAAYWKAERLIMTATGVSAAVHMWTSTDGSFDNPIATYLADAAGVVKIDVTDYIRTYGSKQLRFAETSGNVYLVQVSIAGLINPLNLNIPTIPPVPYAYFQDVLKIVPPLQNIAPLTGSSIKIGLYYTELDPAGSYTSEDGDAVTIGADGKYQIGYIDREDPQQDVADLIVRMVKPQQCDKRYCMVSWESITGHMYRSTFEWIKGKEDVSDAYALMDLNNEYTEIRGRVEGGTIRLTGLCLYDMWYYSQAICSSKVLLSFDGTNEYRVQVTSKSFTMPDGENTNGKIEINVNFRRYDAVTM